MRLCTKNKLLHLVKERKIIIEGTRDIESNFIDDIRFGIRISDDIFLLEKNVVDIEEVIKYKKLNLYKEGIKSNTFYLGKSIEKFSLPDNICGFIFTRSKYARKGFELLKSSNFIAPGFAKSSPCEIVYEIFSPISISNFISEKRYAFILFFELEESVFAYDKKNIKKLPNNFIEWGCDF